MSYIKTATGENTITFDAFYQYIWARNYGDTDVYISNHSDIVAGDDDVALLPANEAVRLTVNGKTLYVLGSTTLEVHAQNFSDSPFAWNEAGEGGGSDVSVVSLSVNENGTYTAPSRTAYSPVTVSISPNVSTKTITENGTYTASTDNLDGYSSVTVDTGIYTGTTTPASTLGKDGDYYYQRVNDFGALILRDDTTYGKSSNTWIGFDFTTTNPITVTKIKARLTNPTSIIYRIGTPNKLLYESDTIEGVAGENEITLPEPVQLSANVTYTAYVILGTNNGCYYAKQNVIGTGKGIVFNNGRYGENPSGTRPQNEDTSNTYAVDFEYETDNAYITSEYRKKSGSWVEL